MAYEGSVELISGIKQANNGTFPLVDASAVRVADNKRLTDALTDIGSDKADKTDTVLETTMSRGRKATTTVGTGSFAFGSNVEASGNYSHAEGNQTVANHYSQHVFGEFNSADDSSEAVSSRGNFVEIVGNGSSENARSNARALDWQGNEYLNGDLYINCDDDSDNGTKVVPLPPVTSADDGSILCVVDGKWKLLSMGISKHEVTENSEVPPTVIEAGERKHLYIRIPDLPEDMAEKTFEVKSTSVSGLPQGVVGTVLTAAISESAIHMNVLLSNQDSSEKYISSGVVTLTYTYFSY